MRSSLISPVPSGASEHLAGIEIDDRRRPRPRISRPADCRARSVPPRAAPLRRAARSTPLDAAAGDDLRGCPRSAPDGSSLNCTETRRLSASMRAGRMFQQRCTWLRRASISLCDSLAALVVFSPPSAACSVERLAPPPEAFSLLSSAATWSASNSLLLGLRLGYACLTGFSASLRSGALAVCGLAAAAAAPPARARWPAA